MLLDDIRVKTNNELNDQLHLLFDSTAIGLESVRLEDMAESHLLIGKELASVLIREYHADPQHAWHTVISILRCLPWRIDPEKAYIESRDGVVDAIIPILWWNGIY